jgi:hypothetical protein
VHNAKYATIHADLKKKVSHYPDLKAGLRLVVSIDLQCSLSRVNRAFPGAVLNPLPLLSQRRTVQLFPVPRE